MLQKIVEDSLYHHSLRLYGISIMEKLTTPCIKNFMSFHRILLRFQTGKMMLSPQNRIMIEKSFAFHLFVFSRGFKDGTFN